MGEGDHVEVHVGDIGDLGFKISHSRKGHLSAVGN